MNSTARRVRRTDRLFATLTLLITVTGGVATAAPEANDLQQVLRRPRPGPVPG